MPPPLASGHQDKKRERVRGWCDAGPQGCGDVHVRAALSEVAEEM